jgi:glycosyltransferase involved in cell wall biosynthesis
MSAVSVLLSVHNGIEFIERSIDSVLSQTHKDFEIIIIDDASTDGTQSILNSYEERDNRVKVHRNQINIGLTKSLNIAINHSKGSLLARIDIDDYWSNDKIEKQVEYFSKNPKCVLCGTAYYAIEEGVNNKGRATYNCLKGSPRKMILRSNPFAHSSVMFKRSIVYKMGGYNENYRYTQDYELWARMLNFGDFGYIKTPLTYITIRRKSLSFQNHRVQKMNGIKIKVLLFKSGHSSLSGLLYMYKEIVLFAFSANFLFKLYLLRLYLKNKW